MKIIVQTLLLIMTLMLSACAQVRADNKGLRLYGNLENIRDTLYVQKIDPIEARAKLVARVTLKDGRFDVVIPLDDACQLFVYERNNMAQNHFSIIGIPGEELMLLGCLPECERSGSPLYKKFFAVESEIKSGRLTPYDYIINHLDDELSAILFSFLTKEQSYQLYPQLPENLKNGRLKSCISMVIARYHKMDRIASGKQTCAVGAKAPDFTLSDINGNPLSLSSLKGKYVILDFWGSWCGSCIGGFPKMKEYYCKYAGKYEVLGVDCKDTEQRWKTAVNKYELPWLHVQMKKNDPNISELYGVEGYPTQILIDPEGTIISRALGEDLKLYQLLDELFSK
jgi:thiol-disulfide isomerase/thioredoxin